MVKKIILVVCAIMLGLTSIYSQTEDIKSIDIDTISVIGYKRTSGIKYSTDGTTLWDMKLLDQMPKILGNADPIRYAQMLPSIQTNNEYDSGIHIEGCESQHNNICIGGVTMYNIAHLMGFFSLFNASHYSSMSIRKTVMDSGDANRLGGSLNMLLPDSIQQDINGEFAVGLISSQGTIRLPLGKRSSLFVSLRTSYLNLLYSHWLKVDGSSIRYSFSDANVTYFYKPSPRNTLWIDAYYGFDNANATLMEFGGDMRMKWDNKMFAAHYLHTYHNGNKLEHNLYTTSTNNDFRFSFSVLDAKLPSSILDIGYKLNWKSKRANAGLETIYHHIQPQSPEIIRSYNILDNTQKPVDSHENSVYADYSVPLFSNLELMGGLRGMLFFSDIKKYARTAYFSLDPNVSLRYNQGDWNCSLNYNLRHQVLHQTGLSTVNFPTEFWISSTDDIPVQYAHCFSALGSYKFKDGIYSISAELYYKRLFNQIEYCGSPVELLTKKYVLTENLYHGRGYNYGASIMVNKHRGRLTGWMSYTYSRARRQFAEYGYRGWFPALHERPHEFNVVTSYELSRRLSLGAAFVAASGTPFTASTSVYAFNGNIIVEKAEHNAARLRPYIRLDLSMNYKLKTKCFKESSLNFSLYNAQIRGNDLSFYVSTYKDHFKYKHVTFILPLLPSISYYAKF